MHSKLKHHHNTLRCEVVSMMNFTWTEFGVLDKCLLAEDGYLKIYNTKGEFRKMSPKYNSIFKSIFDKANEYKGKYVQIRTSQNTEGWSSNQWFSDLSLFQKNKFKSSDIDENVAAPSGEIINMLSANKKLKQTNNDLLKRLKKASDKAEIYQSKYTQAEEEKCILQVEYEALNQKERNEVDKQTEELHELNIVGKDLDIQIKGHPIKLLALRQGIKYENRGRIKVFIKQHCTKNYYRVELLDYDNLEVKVALGFKDKTLFIKTLEPSHKDFRSTLENITGIPEAVIKQSAKTYSLDDLIDMHKKVQKELLCA